MYYLCYLCLFSYIGVKHVLTHELHGGFRVLTHELHGGFRVLTHELHGGFRVLAHELHGGFRVAHLFSFLCCVVFLWCFLFVCLRPVACVPNVASVSGLSILDYPSLDCPFLITLLWIVHS
jgi:hypothetical protein